MKKRLRLWVKIVILIIILATLTLIYGTISNYFYKVNEIALYENINESYNGLKIVHISDLYYGHNINKKQLKKIINNINLIKPDIVVFTGDLLYKKHDNGIRLLSKIEANINKYYVTGDNDFENTNQILDECGFTNLNDTFDLIYKDKTPILIAGLSTGGNYDSKLQTIVNFLNKNELYSILLTHNPSVIDKLNYKDFNLILAGHTLGGIINLPLIGGIILPQDNYLYGKNYYKKGNSKIFISNGLGNNNINFRLNNTPSFNFYRLRSNRKN